MRVNVKVAITSCLLAYSLLADVGPSGHSPANAAVTSIADRKDVLPAGIPLEPSWRVIYFWSSVCPCVRACERYSMIPLALKYRGRVSFTAVASNEFDLAMPHNQLLGLIAQHHLPFATITDTDHTIAKYLNATITPQTFVLDPAGNVVFDGMPDDSRRFLFNPPTPVKGKPDVVPSSYLATALAEGLAGKAVTETPLKEAGCSIDW
jgi:hypothetical protein